MGFDISPGASVALGILVGLVSTCVQSIGLTQQRKSHLLEEQKQEEHAGHVQRPAYRRRRWQLGMLMFLVANIVGSSIQITTLPLPVLSTLQASGLVFNTICATVVLGEPFTKYSLVGTILVAAGAALIGIFGSVTEPSHPLHQLLFLLGRKSFLLWLMGTFFIVIVLILSMFVLKKLHPRQTHRVRLIQGMSYGAVSGILSAHTLLLAKSAVELLVRTIVDHINQFNQWQAWMILLGLVALALAQLYYLHIGLKLCSTSVLYPFVFCIYNIIAILDGLIYFDQGSRLPTRDAALIAVGTAVLLVGVFALSWRLQADDDLPGPAAVDVKVKARVVTPRTILQPGMGLQEEPTSDSESEANFLRPADDDEALNQADHLRATEHTPLLRTKTGPMRTQLHTAAPRDTTFRPPKVRRMATLKDDGATAGLWDELNDRPDVRRFSASTAAHDFSSPRSVRSPHQNRRSSGSNGPRTRSKTLGATTSRSSASIRDLAQLVPSWRPFATSSTSSSPVGGKRKSTWSNRGDVLSPPPPSEPTDVEDGDDDDGGPSSWLLGSSETARDRGTEGEEGEEARPGWFRLRWWKKRWRSEEDVGRGGDVV